MNRIALFVFVPFAQFVLLGKEAAGHPTLEIGRKDRWRRTLRQKLSIE
jgi:hypothetical protein